MHTFYFIGPAPELYTNISESETLAIASSSIALILSFPSDQRKLRDTTISLQVIPHTLNTNQLTRLVILGNDPFKVALADLINEKLMLLGGPILADGVEWK